MLAIIYEAHVHKHRFCAKVRGLIIHLLILIYKVLLEILT